MYVGAEKRLERADLSRLADELALALGANAGLTLIHTPALTVLSTARKLEKQSPYRPDGSGNRP